MNSNKSLMLIFSAMLTIFLCQSSFGQARQVNLAAESTPTPTPEPVTTPTPSAVNLNAELNKTSSAQSSTAMIAAAAAGTFGVGAMVCCAQYSGCGGYCGPFIAAAAGSALVSAENSGKSAGNSDAACKFIAGGCGGAAAKPSGNGAAGSGSTGGDSAMKTPEQVLADTKKSLAAVGAKVDFSNKTVTMPDGRTASLSSGGVSAEMSAAGLTLSDLKKMAAKVAPDKGATKAAEGVEGDGAIGVAGRKGGSGEPGASYALPVSQAPKLGIDRDPAQVAGLTSNLNGTPIGVASDSIFGIIDRRYEYHDKRGSFLPSK